MFTVFRVVRQDNGWFIRVDGVDREFGPYETRKAAESYLPLLHKADSIFSSRASTDLEIAGVIRELVDDGNGFTQKEIASMFNRLETWVSFYQKLNRMPDTLVQYLRANVVRTTALVKAVDEFGMDTTERTIRRIVAERQQRGQPHRITQREIFEKAA